MRVRHFVFVSKLIFIVLAFWNIPLIQIQNISAEEKKINLGLIVPLTGPLAFFGQDFVRAAELAQEDHPEIKERINLLWEDSAYDSKQAVSVFNKLVSVDQADVIISFGGPMLSALAPMAEIKKIPFFATEAAKSDCEQKEYCSLFRNEEDEWGKATWQILRKNGKKNIGIVKNQNQFMNTFVDAIVRNKNDDEKVEIVFDVSPDTVDLKTNVLQLKSKNFDALGVYLLPGNHRGFLSALQHINKSFQLFGVDQLLVNDINQGFENLIDGALVIAPGSIQTYREKFERKHGYSAGVMYTPAFYDFITLLSDTLGEQKNLRGLELIKAMRFTGKRSGVSGSYSLKVSAKGVHSYSFPIFVYKTSKGQVSVEEEIIF
jgi:ABC-type branched-subunit amino acid transport system substrate-binding protein